MNEKPLPQDAINLAGEWRLSDDTGDYVLAMDVPGDAITALQRANKIADPYEGQNEYGLRWIAERDWTLSRTFDLERKDYDLVLSELDTVVSVWLNGHCVLSAENEFRRYRVAVSEALAVGQNKLELRFTSSVDAAAERQQSQPWPVPWHQGNCPIPNGNMLRKVQCDFGWDWNIALAPFGLYGDCFLERKQRARIASIIIDQRHFCVNASGEKGELQRSVDSVLVRVKVYCNVDTAVEYASQEDITDTTLRLTLNGEVHTLTITKSESIATEFTIKNPQLWWPAGLGEQTLYRLEARLGSQSEVRQIGLRQIELITTPDESRIEGDDSTQDGSRFMFRVNGVPVFMRGANWIPADALPGRIGSSKTRALLESAVDANMNMLRVWGGGRYEADSFYQTCDELGLLIWQDFMFSCNLYPSTDHFLQEVTEEVVDNVNRLHHHACVALWCGDNELIGALTWFKESINNRDRYLVSYDRLNRAIEHALKSVCPQANWWPSSPSSGPLNFGDAWHDDRSGDMHFWSVWHEGRDFDHYRDVSPRFCSEFGFQSYPSISAIRTFAHGSDLNIASPVMESHQKNVGGNARIAETMFRYFRFPVDFENFVYLSQVQQGVAIQTAVTHWRSIKPRCMGTLYWQLNDTWPVASWSSLDYGGNWKLLHHMAKRFYAPYLVTTVPVDGGWEIRAVNDGVGDTTIELEVSAITPAGGVRPLNSGVFVVGVKIAETLLEIDKTELRDNEMLLLRWRVVSSDVIPDSDERRWQTDVFAPLPWKSYSLLPTGLGSSLRIESHDSGRSGVWLLTLTAEALGLFVTVEADQPGRFSDNGFFMIPGEAVVVRFTADASTPSPRFLVRDLQQATYSS